MLTRAESNISSFEFRFSTSCYTRSHNFLYFWITLFLYLKVPEFCRWPILDLTRTGHSFSSHSPLPNGSMANTLFSVSWVILVLANQSATNFVFCFVILLVGEELKKCHALCSGRIHSGMLTVKRIGQVETDGDDRPVDDVKITKGGVIM